MLEMNGVVRREEEGMREATTFGVWHGVVRGVLERLVVGIGVGLRVGCDEHVDERVQRRKRKRGWDAVGIDVEHFVSG